MVPTGWENGKERNMPNLKQDQIIECSHYQSTSKCIQQLQEFTENTGFTVIRCQLESLLHLYVCVFVNPFNSPQASFRQC